eukprot:TRINITY_DN62505_c0_g1_i1.p1 TRINITY_DN62505_c0_g1~~TRINITY_DN62505_c0_g1_i1.p1  ORF type:complete len:316 (-),score=36.40 TRINITY_DN62505_c0_g1_i1:174-1121(-)
MSEIASYSQADLDVELSSADRARLQRSSAFVRVFLLSASIAETIVLVPNVLTELQINKGLYAPILRLLLAAVRLMPLAKPILDRLGSIGAATRHFFEVALPAFYGPACGGVEPCRGLATALSGWYLISTPMHDAFSPEGSDSRQTSEPNTTKGAMSLGRQEHLSEIDSELLLPCAIIMSANVALFLCDALALTMSPLLRHSETMVVPLPSYPRAAQVVTVGESVDIETGKFDPTCVICIADFEPGETLAQLPCGHFFHVECVNHWLAENGHCPLRCPGTVLPPHGRDSPRGSDSSVSQVGEDEIPRLIGAPAETA